MTCTKKAAWSGVARELRTENGWEGRSGNVVDRGGVTRVRSLWALRLHRRKNDNVFAFAAGKNEHGAPPVLLILRDLEQGAGQYLCCRNAVVTAGAAASNNYALNGGNGGG